MKYFRYNFAYKKLHLLAGLSNKIKQKIGEDGNWGSPFGKFRQMYYPHALSENWVLDYFLSRKLPGRGNCDTVNVACVTRVGSDTAFTQANMRMVVSFGEEDSFWSTDTGQSGHVLSSHYFDMQGVKPGIWKHGPAHYDSLKTEITIS